tara:strand:+ start:317 stop:487 length:171 start_codon:yes stop_codon:yes gene_type:complete
MTGKETDEINKHGEADALKTHNASELLGEASVAKIELDGQTYLLRKTRYNKLILTK